MAVFAAAILIEKKLHFFRELIPEIQFSLVLILIANSLYYKQLKKLDILL